MMRPASLKLPSQPLATQPAAVAVAGEPKRHGRRTWRKQGGGGATSTDGRERRGPAAHRQERAGEGAARQRERAGASGSDIASKPTVL